MRETYRARPQSFAWKRGGGGFGEGRGSVPKFGGHVPKFGIVMAFGERARVDSLVEIDRDRGEIDRDRGEIDRSYLKWVCPLRESTRKFQTDQPAWLSKF